ncbi:hypothetical protein [Cytobacillus firmus]|uniref:hypothetical protein n=1 Tax=Cytobacillus firmus TaxID=1399 RepID=UPI002228483A|nr:hypothetical protein [Cytobacillus firmus]
MELLNARIIPTQHGMETYLDIPNKITVADVHIPNSNSPFLELKIGIEYFRLSAEHYYDSQTNYFWLRIHPESNSITLLETDIQSLFSVKNDDEREATKELIGEWLINTNAFKQTIKRLINQKRAENGTTEEEFQEALKTSELLKKTLELKTEDILNANLEKYH